MQKLLELGVTLIVDRYSFSGVAYSAAKKVRLWLVVAVITQVDQIG